MLSQVHRVAPDFETISIEDTSLLSEHLTQIDLDYVNLTDCLFNQVYNRERLLKVLFA